MFKLKELDLTASYRLDGTKEDKTKIVPGSILVITTTGVRLANASDTLSVANSRQWLISNDYYDNTGMAVIHGVDSNKEERISAVPLYEKFNFTIDVDHVAERGEEYTIREGKIKTATKSDIAVFKVIQGKGYNINNYNEIELTTIKTYQAVTGSHYGDLLLVASEAVADGGMPVAGTTTADVKITLSKHYFIDGAVADTENWVVTFDDKNTGASGARKSTVQNADSKDIGAIFTLTGADSGNLNAGKVTISMVGAKKVVDADFDPKPVTFDIEESV